MQDLSECRVLIVDDSKTNVDVLAQTLRDDYKLSVALDGVSALQNIERGKPDLILLDIIMPGMTGFQVAEKLQSDPATSSIPIIFISALTEENDKVTAFAHGGVDYVTKPFQAQEVKARVRTHLDIKRMRDQLEGVATSAQGANTAHLKIAVAMAQQLAKPIDLTLELIPELLKETDAAKIHQALSGLTEKLQRSKGTCQRLLAAAGVPQQDP